MTKCSTKSVSFSRLKSKKVESNFTGGKITSDGGILLLREIDKKIGLTKKIARLIPDYRNQSYTTHSVLQMLRQRVYGLALGYEDLNDHNELRRDGAIQTAIEFEHELASSPTLCRFENQANREIAVAINRSLVDQFIASFKTAPKKLVLDFDATDLPIHGQQEGRAFHGYYGHHCYLPLHVFCGDRLLVSYLRKSNEDQAKHAWAILSLLVKRFRQVWPECSIIFRADSGFCRQKMLNWCDKNNVDYIIGISGNSRLKLAFEDKIKEAEKAFEETKKKQRLFSSLNYAARSWSKERRVIGKAEHTEKGSNPRFIVTSLKEDAQMVYDESYCARGDMENRIKEQLLLFSDRISCHKWWANQLRLLFSALAYVLLERLRTLTLQGTIYARSRVDTIRLKLLKIGGIVIRNSRRIRLLLSEYYPSQELFFKIAHYLSMI
jgi:hypothetical protein